MGTVQANGICVAYETKGNPGGIPLVLVHDLGMQLVAWPDELLDMLVRRGYRVVVFDHRDAGLSTHVEDGPPPDPLLAMAGDTRSASYTLDDMAADTAGLLDALGLGSAHLIGVSLGGMIAQTLALWEPARVRNLTSIMSTTGNPEASRPTPDAAAVLFQPAAATAEEFADQTVQVFAVIGSTGFPPDEQLIRDIAVRAYHRSYDPAGIARQLVAIYASAERTTYLAELDLPALVVHGADDPLITVTAGRLTAEAIPGAELLEIEGMGHDLPREVWDHVVDRIDQVVRRREARVP